MNQENQKKFTGVFIPAFIFNMQELSWKEKILWCEIQALAGDDVCFATNEYFAEQFNTTPSKISNIISKLKKFGLVKQVFFDGRTRHLKVCFDTNGQCRLAEMGKADLSKSAMQDYQNGQGSIYMNKENNKNNNKSIKEQTQISKKSFIPPTLDECKDYAKELHCKKELGSDFYNYYNLSNWIDGKGKQILRWKQKMYQWYMHDKQKYYNDIPDKPDCPSMEEYLAAQHR